jgi:hypothetical protein
LSLPMCVHWRTSFLLPKQNLGLHSRVQHLEHLMLFSCHLASQSALWSSSDATLFWSWPFLALLRRVLVRTTQISSTLKLIPKYANLDQMLPNFHQICTRSKQETTCNQPNSSKSIQVTKTSAEK